MTDSEFVSLKLQAARDKMGGDNSNAHRSDHDLDPIYLPTTIVPRKKYRDRTQDYFEKPRIVS